MPDTTDTVVIFAPLPILTVTIEDRAGEPDIHLHAGGQGVWQSRMVSSLGGAVGRRGSVAVPHDRPAVRAVS